MSNSIQFPTWFTVLTWILVISNFFIFGLFSLIHPELPWPDLGKTDAAFPIQFFAARHLTFAIPLLYGILKKNVTILKTCYTIFFILAIIDFLLLAIYGYYIPVLYKFVGELPFAATLTISIGAFIAPMGIALKHLSSYSK